MMIETKRLLIRPMGEQDARALHPVLSDPEVMKYMEAPFDWERTKSFIATAGLASPPLVYTLEQRADGHVIGYVIYHAYHDSGSYEIGWVISKGCWGVGYAAEATEALIRQARAQGLCSLVIECAPAQTVSRHIAKKYGFHYAGNPNGLHLYKLPL